MRSKFMNHSTLAGIYKELETRISRIKHPWSIAELKLSVSEIEFLSAYVNEITESRFSRIRLDAQESDEEVTNLHILGLLIISLWAEKVRDVGTEGSVWPVARRVISDSSPLYSFLFLYNGQLTCEAKELIEKAVTIFDMRNVIDIEGTHEWFETIKLQFGFTYKGGKKRLAEWLMNIGRPHATQYLMGEMAVSELMSDSFYGMWSNLIQYRRGLITDQECARSLKRQPWIKNAWIEDLLKSAVSRKATLGVNPGDRIESALDDEVEESPIERIFLDWDGTEKPRIIIRVNKELILDEVKGLDVNELRFMLDGAKRSQWRKQRNGEWSGRVAFYTDSSSGENPLPSFLTIKSNSGNVIKEWNLSDSGLSESVMVFDIEKEKLIRTGLERINQNGKYAILFDSDASLVNTVPIAESQVIGTNLRAVILPSPLTENIRIEFDEFTLWQPVDENSNNRERISISIGTVEDKFIDIGCKTNLSIRGIPESSVNVKLLIGKRKFECLAKGEDWTTLDEVCITPELLLKATRVIVKYEKDSTKHSRVPRITIPTVAVLARLPERSGQFSLQEVKDSLNKSDAIVDVHFITPDEGKKRIIEGGSQIGFLKHNRAKLSKFNGHGGEVLLKTAEGKEYHSGVSIHDTGIVKKFTPAMLGCKGRLVLNEEKERFEDIEEGYDIIVWEEHNEASRVRVLSKSNVKHKKGYEYEVSDNTFPLCLAVTYEGAWLGSFVDDSKVCSYLKHRNYTLLEQEHSLLRWFRVPLLKNCLSAAYSTVVAKQPRRFLKVWDKNQEVNLPDYLQPHDSIRGIPSVIRHFMWSNTLKDGAEDIVEMFASGKSIWKKKNEVHLLFEKLARISPITLWYGFRCLNRYKPNLITDVALTYYLRQINSTRKGTDALRMYESMLYKVADRTGLSIDDIEASVCGFVSGIGISHSSSRNFDINIVNSLGESILGRQLLAAMVGKEWLRLSSGEGF